MATLGVTEASVGCEIRSSMEVVTAGETPDRGVPVYVDAAAADAIVPVNRIKPHTDFGGDVESGLSKMLVIGMGKQRGAKMAHDWAADWSLRNVIPELTERLLAELPVAGGVAVVEDQYDNTTLIEGIGTLENTVVRNRLGDTTILEPVGPWSHRQFRRGSEPVPVPRPRGVIDDGSDTGSAVVLLAAVWFLRAAVSSPRRG